MKGNKSKGDPIGPKNTIEKIPKIKDLKLILSLLI